MAHDQAADHLDQARAALVLEDWEALHFHIEEATRLTHIKERVKRSPYDIDVVWTADNGQRRTEFVRVLAATRALAHDVAQTWARTNFELDEDTTIFSTILDED